MILRKPTNTHVGYGKLLENFFTPLKIKSHAHWNPFFEGPPLDPTTFAFERGMKTEKSPSPYVWDYKIWLKHHWMLSFNFRDRYDPKEAYKHTCWVLEAVRKFFHATQSQVSCSLKSSFWRFSTAPSHFCFWGGYENWKIAIYVVLWGRKKKEPIYFFDIFLSYKN